MALRKYLDWKHWLRCIWTSAIKGGAQGALGAVGAIGGYVAGANVKPLEFSQLAVMFTGAAVVNILIFLQANPFPQEIEETVNTNPPIPPPTK